MTRRETPKGRTPPLCSARASGGVRSLCGRPRPPDTHGGERTCVNSCMMAASSRVTCSTGAASCSDVGRDCVSRPLHTHATRAAARRESGLTRTP